ncbi:hypothetical protein [Pseudomonas aeruginosa]|uniref:hypothetical protein n=1 Tax=Pseudomonas aeruginosa TaxID=287 RepID=UPI001CA5014A|nr:hypothetical protein [Pseudomonas aeruginosa]MBW6072313.1 hypothetical protein [Pseudomonas aeruginosa]
MINTDDKTIVGISFETKVSDSPIEQPVKKTKTPKINKQKEWEKVDDPREYTKEEQTSLFVNWLQSTRNYWHKQYTDTQNTDKALSIRDMLDGFIYSIAAGLDGNDPNIPGFKLIPNVTQEDIDYLISIGENHWPVNPVENLKDNIRAKCDAVDISGNLRYQVSKTFTEPFKGPHALLNHFLSLAGEKPVKYYSGNFTQEQLAMLVEKAKEKAEKIQSQIADDISRIMR